MLLAGALRRRCWPGCRGRATAERRSRGRAAGWSAVAELLAGGAMAKRPGSRGRDTVAREIHLEEGKATSEKNMHLSFQMNKI